MKRNIPSKILVKAQKIKAILMDVDGVMTHGKIVYDSNGIEIKHFNAHDGLGITLARLAGVKTGIISSRESGTIRVRAAELKMDYLYLGRNKKFPALQELCQKHKFSFEELCFIGDDLPDIPIIKTVGLGVAVLNATEMTKKAADYITHNFGGEGAVREIVEIVLQSQNLFEKTVKKVSE
jgi:3-deoxy-D-manno-octulosonate 8-phosphate phosphatase (KDO 8-P phosphatase)